MMKHILYAADSRFYSQLYVSAFSFCENLRKGSFALPTDDEPEYTLHIIAEGFSAEQKERLKQMAESHGVRLAYYGTPEVPRETTVTFGRSLATYYRINAPSLLPEEVETVLYLDCDTIIEQPPDDLFALNWGNDLIAGVQDTMAVSYLQNIGLTSKDRYVNAGVLMMNLKAWRREGVEEQCAACLENHNFSLPNNDQDVLNDVCRGRIRFLPLRFNVLTPCYRYTADQIKRLRGIETYYSEEERQEAVRNPAVIHYAGTVYDRPWNRVCDHPAGDRFLFYAQKAGIRFESASSPAASLKKAARKCFRLLPFAWQLKIREKIQKDA